MTSSVPYFKINDFAIYNNLFLHKVSTDSSLVRLQELLIDIADWSDTYALRRDVFPTAESPRIITLDSFFLLINYCNITMSRISSQSQRQFMYRFLSPFARIKLTIKVKQARKTDLKGLSSRVRGTQGSKKV